MKKISFLLTLVLVIIGCKGNENQKATETLSFQTQEGTVDYAFNSYFENGDGIHIRLELLQFYITNIRFVNKKGKEVEAGEVALIKLDISGRGSTELKIPAGNYSAIRFGIGTTPEMNDNGPAAYTEQGHPLGSLEGTYWSMTESYRFIMLDGKYDLTGDGTDEGGFSYHTGFDECYREVELIKDFSFDRRENYAHQINIDISKLFYATGSNVDVPVESNFHGDYSDIDLANRISNNFAAALSFE